MFTGIIQEQGTIKQILPKGGKTQFNIACSKMQNDLKIGDSICTNGICLSVIHFNNDSISLEAMHETLLKTTAGSWKNNQSLHLERAMKLSDRLDGHIVQGHTDTKSTLIQKRSVQDTLYLTFALQEPYRKFLVPQGSVAIDGVSLTVSDLTINSFSVSLISLTEKETHLGRLNMGESVNIEFDILGKYVLNSLKTDSKITEAYLIENGF